MTCKKILIATDFSPASKEALRYASALARQWNASLLIVHVEEPPVVMNEGWTMPEDLYPNPEVRKMLEAVAPTESDIPYEHRLVLGAAAEEITKLAESEHADLIVMGTHGRTGVARLLMGSVAEAVLRHAKCPLLTLKAPTAQAAAAPERTTAPATCA